MPYKADDFFVFSAFDPGRMLQGVCKAAQMGVSILATPLCVCAT